MEATDLAEIIKAIGGFWTLPRDKWEISLVARDEHGATYIAFERKKRM